RDAASPSGACPKRGSHRGASARPPGAPGGSPARLQPGLARGRRRAPRAFASGLRRSGCAGGWWWHGRRARSASAAANGARAQWRASRRRSVHHRARPNGGDGVKPARQRWELWGQGTLAVAALLSVLACDAKPQRPREADSAGLKPAAAASPSESAVGGRASSAPPAPARDRGPFDHRFRGAERMVAIGDLHGDSSATKQVLSLAGALGESGDWVGGELVVVQTGDQLDRGDDERGILDLLESLAAQAQDAGGRL